MSQNRVSDLVSYGFIGSLCPANPQSKASLKRELNDD